MLSTVGKKFSRWHIEVFFFFLFFPENRIWHFMQIVSIGEILFSGKNKNDIFNLSSAELAQRVVKVTEIMLWKYRKW